MGKYFSKEKWSYMFYTIAHPMDGYYWIRHRDRGSVPLAILMVFLFSCSFTANRLLASFVVNDIDPRGVDSLYELQEKRNTIKMASGTLPLSRCRIQ